MLLQQILLTLHIIAAGLWLGGGIYATLAYRRHAAEGTLSRVMAVEEKIGAFFGVAVVTLLLTGIGMVLNSERFSFTHAFVIIGIGAIVVSGALEGRVFGPAMKRAGEAEGPASFPAPMRWALPWYVVVFVFVVWAMVAKLGA
ncbi:MAG TPA: hypothetical protein VF246_01250 [Acidimicrobiia bacterium]